MGQNQMSDDQEILNLIHSKGDKDKAFSIILKRFHDRLYWHIRSMVGVHEDANDVLQNVMIKAFRAIDRFEGKSSLYTWLYTIATNESITFIKKRKRKSSVSIDNEDLALSERLKSDEFFDEKQAEFLLSEAIEHLPDKQKLVFNMRYFDSLPYQQIEEMLGTSTGALKASYHHAVKKIEAYISAKI